MNRRFKKPIALFTSLVALSATALVMFAVPAGANIQTPPTQPCEGASGCVVGGGGAASTAPIADGGADWNLGASFTVLATGYIYEVCYPVAPGDAGTDLISVWDGGVEHVIGAATSGCKIVNYHVTAGLPYTVSYNSGNTSPANKDYFQETPDKGSGSPPGAIVYNGGVYSAGTGTPPSAHGYDFGVEAFVYSQPLTPTPTIFQDNNGNPMLNTGVDADALQVNVHCTSTVGGSFSATLHGATLTSPIPITGMGQITPLTPPGYVPVAYNTVTCSVDEISAGGFLNAVSGIATAQLVPTSGPGCAATNVTAPTALLAQPEAFPGAVVSWAPATASPQNCISGYQITPTSGSTVLPAITVNGGGTTSVVVKGLTEGSTYTFTVAAITGSGVGPQSAVVGPITIGTPAAVTHLKASNAGKGAIKVSFKAGANNGAEITKFTATCKSSDGGLTRSASAKSSPITVRVSAGHKYTCTVTATNSRGTGKGAVSNHAKA